MKVKRLFQVVTVSVVVFGSLNVDVVFRCRHMPKPGETVLCRSYETGPGGKGLNQAVAARRAGSDVDLVGAVGDDGYGSDLARFLAREGIGADGVQRRTGMATGIAHIAVDEAGENAIIVASGANAAIAHWPGIAAKPPVWLAQLEIAPSAVAEFLRSGREAGATCVLNAAPALSGAQDLFPLCDVIVVNEHELADFAGMDCNPADPHSIERAAAAIVDCTAQILIVTLGARGTQIIGPAGSQLVPARKVTPSDTTGAGDCFCGVLADGLARGLAVSEAVRRANTAAAIAVQRPGAAGAMPTAAEISAFVAA